MHHQLYYNFEEYLRKETQRCYFFVMFSLVVILFLQLQAMRKCPIWQVLFRGYWQVHGYLPWLTGYQGHSDKKWYCFFKHIYNAPGTTLGEIRCNMFARKAAGGWSNHLHRGSRRCTVFSTFLSSNQGLDAFAKHSFEPWMDSRDSWLWASSHANWTP